MNGFLLKKKVTYIYNVTLLSWLIPIVDSHYSKRNRYLSDGLMSDNSIQRKYFAFPVNDNYTCKRNSCVSRYMVALRALGNIVVFLAYLDLMKRRRNYILCQSLTHVHGIECVCTDILVKFVWLLHSGSTCSFAALF